MDLRMQAQGEDDNRECNQRLLRKWAEPQRRLCRRMSGDILGCPNWSSIFLASSECCAWGSRTTKNHLPLNTSRAEAKKPQAR